METADVLRKKVKKYIDNADDKTVQMVYAMLEAENKYDFWDELPDEVKADIDISLSQADSGQLIAHEDVMSKYNKWLTK